MVTMNDLIGAAERRHDSARRDLERETQKLTTMRDRVEAGDQLITDAQITQAIKARDDARAELDAVAAKLDTLRAEKAEDDRIDALSQVIIPTGAKRSYTDTRADGKGFLSLRGLAAKVRESAEREGGYNVRALLAAGSTAAVPVILNESPIGLGKPATGLLDVIPVRTVSGGEYSYLQQTARTNNAAPVAVGGTKPTSVMTLTRITGTLEVVAHLSEAIHEPWLEDVPALNQFVQDELGAGLNSALEDELLNGSGVSPSLAGIVATATGTQAYATSPLVTIRTAIAQMEAAGLVPSAVVLASADWLAIETATVTGGAYLLGDGATGAPLDRIKRTVWGVPVVVSVAHTAGTAVLLSEDSVGLVTDGAATMVWGRINTDFQLNQVRARAEIRAQVEVYRPAGVIICDLTA